MSAPSTEGRTRGSDPFRLHRLVRILPALLGGERSRSQLLALLAGTSGGATLSTLTRDIRMLKRLGWLSGDGLKSGAYKPGPALPLWLSTGEHGAIRLAQRVMAQLGLPEAELLADLATRATAQLGGTMAAGPDLLPSTPGRVDPDSWSSILHAMASGKRIRLSYRRQTGEVAPPVLLDRLEPRWLTGAVYLVGLKVEALAVSSGWQALREYRLDRIEAIELTEAPCHYTELPWLRVAFRVDAFLQQRLVEIRTSEGRTIQEIRPCPDGTLRVVTHETGLVRARQRILALAPHIHAVEGPPELLEELRRSMMRFERTLAASSAGWTGDDPEPGL